MAKLNPEQREQVLVRIASGASYEEAAKWCKKTFRISITKQAIGLLVNKHRSERSEVSKAVARDHIAKKLPKDLVTSDEKHAQAAELLDRAAAAAMASGSVADFEKYSKAAQVYLKFEQLSRDTMGLNQPDDPMIDGLVGLLGLALEEEEQAAEKAAHEEQPN